MADSQLYSRLLLSKGAGYPLWLPEPYDDLPTEYKETGVAIGDVGTITSDGAFDFVFNICVPRDDPVNSVGVPEGFEVIALGPGDIRRAPRHYPPGSDVSTAKLKKRSLAIDASSGDNIMIPAGGGAGLSISTSSREAAILLLPDGGASFDLRRKQLFRDYALKHADEWYRFLNIQLGRMVENGSMYLVTGCDKTTSWGVACFSQDTSEGEVSLELKASLVASGSVSYSWQSADVSPVAARAGPDQPGSLNQAVFLRGYKVMLRERFPALRGPVKVSPVETAKPRDLLSRKTSVPYSGVKQSPRPDFVVSGSKGSTDSEVVLESFPEPFSVYHPSDMINTLLLEDMQDASVAVTHDSEWASVVLQDETAIPDGQQLYHRLRERYALRMNENGVYFDSPDNSLEGVAGDIPVTSALETGAKEERKWSVPSFLSSFGHVRYLRPIRSLESSVNPGMSEETATSDISLVPERVIRLLLLGQSESGKSTLLRQFQRLYDSEMFEQQRSAWRPVIQLNILSSIRTILAAVSPRIVPGRLSPAEVSDTITDTPALVVDSASGIQLNSFSHIENLTTALLPLLEVEDVLSHALGVSADKNLTVPSQVPAAIESPPTVEMNPARIHDSNTEVTISRPREPNTSTQFAGSNGLETTTQSVLHSLSGDMLRLWEDSDVQAMLDTKEIHLEESPGFFLNDLPRVTALNYVPSDDDVMKARQKTIEASDYTFKMKPNQYSDGQTWSITDVGGSKAQRQQWSTFFQNVSAIIFLAPMSCFNQSLTEDSNINRLEDSWTLWKEICSNILLAQVDLILFLNKYDIFDRKLKAGIQLSKFIPSYRDRSNDVKTASAYLRSKFSAIHKTHSPAPRHLHCFFTSVTDAPSSLNVIRSVQDTVARQNLASSDLI